MHDRFGGKWSVSPKIIALLVAFTQRVHLAKCKETLSTARCAALFVPHASLPYTRIGLIIASNTWSIIIQFFRVFVHTKQSFAGYIAQIFMIIFKGIILNSSLDFMMLPEYLYFTTWSIWHPLKYTLIGWVSPNSIHLVLISFTLYAFC